MKFLIANPISLCEQYPQVSLDHQIHRNSFSESQAHSLRSGTPNPLFCLESGDSTNMGLRHITSMEGHSRARPLENSRLKDLVAEQRETQGSAFSPRKEERLMMALRFLRWDISLPTSAAMAAMLMQLTLMMSTICWKEQCQNSVISDVPTLLTKRAISNSLNCDTMAYHFTGSELSLKSNTILRNQLVAK